MSEYCKHCEQIVDDEHHVCMEMRWYLERENADLRRQLADIEKLVYVPGMLKCAKCDFVLMSHFISPDLNKIKANNEPQQCANGCGPMWRVTERDAGNEVVDRMIAQRDKYEKQLAEARVPEGWKIVPVEPTEEQWSGLARDIMMWMDFTTGPKRPVDLIKHLDRCGHVIPQWMLDEPEMKNELHSMSKGMRCILIYKAILSAVAPTKPG